MSTSREGRRLGRDEIGCLVVWLAGTLALGWFGWLVAVLTLESSEASAAAGLVLVGLPSSVLALSIARSQQSRKLAWFLGVLLVVVFGSFLLMLLIVSLSD